MGHLAVLLLSWSRFCHSCPLRKHFSHAPHLCSTHPARPGNSRPLLSINLLSAHSLPDCFCSRLSALPSLPVSCCHPCLNPSSFLSLLFCACPPGFGSPVPLTGFPTLLQYLSSPPCSLSNRHSLLFYYTGVSVCAVWASVFPLHFPVFLPANYIKAPTSSTRARVLNTPDSTFPKKARKVEYDHPAPIVLTSLRWI